MEPGPGRIQRVEILAQAPAHAPRRPLMRLVLLLLAPALLIGGPGPPAPVIRRVED